MRHTVFAVIHVASGTQARENAWLAHDAGCDGVFLISHGLVDTDELLAITSGIATEQPGWWVGVNTLGSEPAAVFTQLTDEIEGVWFDDARIDERTAAQPEAERIEVAREATGWNGLVFGGVAFKHQRQIATEELARAARLARGYVDVVTTSGDGTGVAPTVEKIAAMKAALGDFPLAVASGMTPDNVADYLPHADSFLVATGMSDSFYALDEAKTRAIVRRVKWTDEHTDA